MIDLDIKQRAKRAGEGELKRLWRMLKVAWNTWHALKDCDKSRERLKEIDREEADLRYFQDRIAARLENLRLERESINKALAPPAELITEVPVRPPITSPLFKMVVRLHARRPHGRTGRD